MHSFPVTTIIFILSFSIFGCTHATAQRRNNTGIHNQTLSIDGTQREFSYYKPGNATAESLPVVIYLHGHGASMRYVLGNGRRTTASSVWMDVAAREGFIVIYPLGLEGGGRRPKTGWNDCRPNLEGNPQSDDIAFIRQLIAYAVQQHNADPRRVYITGMSNGGHMTMRAGMEMANEIAAIAPVVSLMPKTHTCTPPARPVPILMMHGTDDPLAPFEGGNMAGNRGEVYSARETADIWVQWNRLDNIPEQTIELPDVNTRDRSHIIARTRETSPSGNAVIAYEIQGGGHTEPSKNAQMGRLLRRIMGNQNRDIETAEIIWAFFKTRTR